MNLCHMCGADLDSDKEVLCKSCSQDYEEQANHKKVVISKYGVAFCPCCKGSVWQNKDESKYCFRCGKNLTW